MLGPLVSRPADAQGQRRIRRSRVLSYVLVALGVVLFALTPSQLGVPDDPTLRVLVVVVRPIVAGVLVLAALGVQIVVGVQWRRDLTRAAEDDGPDPDEGRARR